MRFNLFFFFTLFSFVGWTHPGEQNILCINNNNIDEGVQYNHTKKVVRVPIENCTDSVIIVSGIYYKTTYEYQCYKIRGRFSKINARLEPGQKDTILFERKQMNTFKEGLIDNSFEIRFENNEHQQYINIFCEIKVHEGVLKARPLNLPTFNRGEVVQLEQYVVNEGDLPAELYVNKYNQKAYFSEQGRFQLLNDFPIMVAPRDSAKITYLLYTQQLYKEYRDKIYLDSNTDKDWGRVVMSFSGSLISEHYPSIKFDSLTMHQYVNEYDRCEFEFAFENDGDEPLLITSCKTSCGCLVATWPKEPILPGERNVIKIKYDSKRIGPINKSCTVRTNVSDQPIVLRVKGMVKPIAR